MNNPLTQPNDYIYDIETYPNCFTFGCAHSESPFSWVFEISDFRNDAAELVEFLQRLRSNSARLIGFNNIGFDYPVLHLFLKMNGQVTAKVLYDKAQSIIDAEDSDRFSNMVYPSDRIIEQLDLYKIHHFDNKARATGLKALEFNMGSDSIRELPFPVGSVLNKDQIAVLKTYNLHDVSETKKFYHHTLPMIKFREELTLKYSRDFMNHNDTKIGKDYFIMCLEEAGVPCYEYGPKGRQPRQTKRTQLVLKDAILSHIGFNEPELNRVLGWLKDQVITETKGVFKKLIASIGGFDFVFGTGGIHGSVSNRVIEADDEYKIIDLDVKSFYPNIAIVNNFYPEHLGEDFCKIYAKLFEMRKSYGKDTTENAMLKLALNGTYGDTNNKYGPFFDPLCLLKITLNGQLLLCKLAEELMRTGAEIIQVNTDGVTIRAVGDAYKRVCKEWEEMTRLTLEQNNYKRMFIRDVNSYLAEYENGDVKRKGAYEYKMGWHQDHSSLVIPKVAEQALLHDAPIAETVMNWSNLSDFMICVKVPRSSYLEADGVQIQNTCRYYVSTAGVQLNKWMPPLKDKTEWRKIGVCKGRKVAVCNDLSIVGDDWKDHVDYSYYINEVEKLVMGLS